MATLSDMLLGTAKSLAPVVAPNLTRIATGIASKAVPGAVAPAPTLPQMESVDNTPTPLPTRPFTETETTRLANTVQKFGAPTSVDEEIEYLKATFSPAELSSMGINEDQLNQAKTAMTQAGEQFMAAPKPTTTGLNYLQQALKTKADLANAPSESEALMGQAGLSKEHAALPTLLNVKSQEIDNKINFLKDTLMKQGTKEADVYNAALDKYKILKEEYDDAYDRMTTIVDRQMQYDQEIALQDRKIAADKEMKLWEWRKDPTIIEVGDKKYKYDVDTGTYTNIESFTTGLKSLENSRYTSSGSGASNGAGFVDPMEIISGFMIDNRNLVDSSGNVIARVTSPYGANHTNISGETKHNGIDVVFNNGNVKSLISGTIVGKGKDPAYGGFVQVKQDGTGNVIQFGHMNIADINNLVNGTHIEAGSSLGRMGTDKESIGGNFGAHTDIRYIGTEGLNAGSNKTDFLIATSGLPTQLKNSDAEMKRWQEGFDEYRRQDPNLSPLEIADRFMGFVVTDPSLKPLATSLRLIATDTNVNLSDVARNLNAGNAVGAMEIVERGRLSKADKNFSDVVLTNAIVTRTNDALKILEENPEIKDWIGPYDSKLLKYETKIPWLADRETAKKATQFASILADINKGIRKKFLGSAITDTEMSVLEPYLTSMDSQPGIIDIKLKEMQQSVLNDHNAARSIVGLPNVNISQLLNPKLRLDLYRGLVFSSSSNSWQSKASEMAVGYANDINVLNNYLTTKGL